jgi:hypothetical protein
VAKKCKFTATIPWISIALLLKLSGGGGRLWRIILFDRRQRRARRRTRTLQSMHASRLVLLLALAGGARALVPTRPAARPIARRAAPESDEARRERRKGMTDWEIYTDGEYGAAFKFPWEVDATDKTAVGHALPIALVASLYLLPLAFGVATGAITF